MANQHTANTEQGYTGLPMPEIINCSQYQQNEVIRCPALMQLSDIEWTAKNQSAIFQAYDGLASGFVKYAGVKQESKKATWSTVTKPADPYLLPLGFGPFTLDDVVNDPAKLGALVSDVAAALADKVEELALVAFGTAAVKQVVDDFADDALTLDVVINACRAFGKFQRRNKSLLCHPDVFAKIKSLAGTYNVAGTDATIVSGEIAKFGGCTIFQSNYCDVTDGVYTSYISLDAAYQYGLPAVMSLEQKTEQGKLEKYLDASFSYVDYAPKAIGGVKRVLEVTHRIAAAPGG